MKLSQSSVRRVLSAPTYQEFIKYYKEEVSKESSLSYGQIALRAGFASRSFTSDVVSGRKELSLSTLMPMVIGLSLKSDLAEYFKHLVYVQHPHLCFPKKALSRIQSRLKNLKTRLLAKEGISILSNHSDASQAHLIPVVYAACGGEEGVSISEVSSKTNLSPGIALQVLTEMVNKELVSNKQNKYFCRGDHISLQNLNNKSRFVDFYTRNLQNGITSAKANFEDENKLFFSSSFSIPVEQMPALKEELREVLLSFADSSEDANGDSVAVVSCFFESLKSLS